MARRSIASALNKIRNERLGQATAADQYEVEDENDRIYEVLSDEEYQKRNKARKIHQFVEGADSNDDEDEEYDFYDYDKPAHNSTSSHKKIGKMKPLVQHFVEMARKGGEAKQSHTEKDFDIKKYYALEMELDDEDVGIGRKNCPENDLVAHKIAKSLNSFKHTQNITTTEHDISLYSDNASQSSISRNVYTKNNQKYTHQVLTHLFRQTIGQMII